MPNRNLEVILLCPTGQDSELIAAFMGKEDIGTTSVGSIEGLCGYKQEDLGVLIIADEALPIEGIEILNQFLSVQEAWSDIPIILLTSGGGRRQTFKLKRLELFVSSGNVTLLERPLRPLSLLSATKVALRARRRQYQVRDLLQSLTAATKIRDEFISIASHELKTPITSLKLQTQMSKRKISQLDTLPLKALHQQLDYTINQTDRLNKLVDDMLDISRISTGRLKLQIGQINFSSLVLDLVDRFSLQFEAAGITIESNIVPDVRGYFDSYKMEQVLNNIFSNSIKYAPETLLKVDLNRDLDNVFLRIQDFGSGIDEENIERIFERYERASPSRGGLGLGLYITRQIIELHGGTIKAESGPDKGTTFIIELPLSQEPEDFS